MSTAHTRDVDTPSPRETETIQVSPREYDPATKPTPDDAVVMDPATKPADDEAAAAEALKKRKAMATKIATAVVFAVAVTLLVSIVSYLIALRLGTHSMAQLGDQLQVQMASVVKIELDRRLAPLVIFLRQVVDFIDETQIDVEDNAQLRGVIPVAHSFLRNYFDDSRCCFGAYVNMQFAGDPGPISAPGVLGCHAIEAPPVETGCTPPTTFSNPRAQFAGVLHYSNTYANQSGFFSQVLPETPAGSNTNRLYFKSYEGGLVMNASNPENHVGFVPLQYADGYWFWLNVRYGLQKKDVRFAPVFPFDLYPPVVLKTHATTPLFSPDGRRVGAMVTGFKLHWVSQFLSSLRSKPGMFLMLVERGTGFVVATSNTDWSALDENNKPIHASNISADPVAQRLADRMVAQAGGNWSAVQAHRATKVVSDGSSWSDVLFGSQPRDDFIIVFDYKYFGVDWVGGIHIPYASIMAEIEDTRVSLGVATILIGVGLRGLGKFLELTVLFLLQRCIGL